ncbi:hypothetical protein VE00_08672 [Pseudogymnoascus sp. WSF 3629]|nr:hypothetical protein VE00_08672 [Pseudogymnoascus sp. WSF 3629]
MAGDTISRMKLSNLIAPETESFHSSSPPCAESVSPHLPGLLSNTKTECDITTPLQPYHDFLESIVTPVSGEKHESRASSAPSAPLAHCSSIASAAPTMDDIDDSVPTNKSPPAATSDTVYPTYGTPKSRIRLRLQIPPFLASSDNNVASPHSASPMGARSLCSTFIPFSPCAWNRTQSKGRCLDLKIPNTSDGSARHVRQIFTRKVIHPSTRHGRVRHGYETVTHTITETLPTIPGGVHQVHEVINRTIVIFEEPARAAPKKMRRKVGNNGRRAASQNK